MIRSNAAPPSLAARSSSAARIVDNAFRVLGLTPRATWPEVARTAEALLAALEAGDVTASSYDTPLGPQPRSAGAVRVARARLRDPDERIQQEIWWEAPRKPSDAEGIRPRRGRQRRWGSWATDWSPEACGVGGPWAPRVIGGTPDDAHEPWPQAPAAWGWRPR